MMQLLRETWERLAGVNWTPAAQKEINAAIYHLMRAFVRMAK